MKYSYKRLGVDSINDAQKLRQLFARAFDEDDTWNANKPSDSYLETVLADNKYIALVATEGDQVVGGLVGYVLPKIDQERSEIYLYDLAVSIEHRRQGVATQLITELKNIAKTYRADTIFVQVDNEDVAAVALYTKLSRHRETEITHFDIAVS